MSPGLPYSLKVLLENLLRHEDDVTVDRRPTSRPWPAGTPAAEPTREIAFAPARILMQDFTGVPAVVDLAAMRDAMAPWAATRPGSTRSSRPSWSSITRSWSTVYGTNDAYAKNAELEFARNGERYRFLRWGQTAFDTLRVVPPNTGICHQVNLEYLARVVFTSEDGQAYPDTLLGTDSHTTMINGLGVLGWGVGGIEAEAAMLGQPVSMLIPRVVGFKLTGTLPEGSTATDLVLTVTELLRKHKVVGKFVEFYGDGVGAVPLENRATIGNMSPEYGSTCAIFPIDADTLRYLELTGRPAEQIALVEAYAKEQGLWHDPAAEPDYSERLELDLSTVRPSLAGPARPQDRVPLERSKPMFRDSLGAVLPEADKASSVLVDGRYRKAVPVIAVRRCQFDLDHGHVVIAAITSCTNTSNPSVMVAAGLVAKKAVERGLTTKPWVKTSLAPGSKVVIDYYERSGLLPYLEKLRFNLVGYGCTTCIGNSGPLLPEISQAINDEGLSVAAVLSGNRNFEGRIGPEVRMNYLASPPLVVAYALAGTMDIDLYDEPLGTDTSGEPVYLRDLWPTEAEIAAVIGDAVVTGHVPQELRRGVQRRRTVECPRYPDRGQLRLGCPLDLCPQPSLFRRHARDPGAAARYCRSPGAGPPRRQRDHRPHLPGGEHPQGRSRRSLAGRRGSGRRRFQLLRLPPGQPRGHDPGHLRQRPPAQSVGARHRGGRDPASARRRADVDLRRRRALQGRRGPAGDAGRKGIRVGIVPGLGGQGHRAPRCAGCPGRELRADPSARSFRPGPP